MELRWTHGGGSFTSMVPKTCFFQSKVVDSTQQIATPIKALTAAARSNGRYTVPRHS